MSVEDRVKSIEDKVDKLMTNDIPHLNERLGRVETNLSWTMKLTIMVLGGVVAALVKLFLGT